MKASSLALTYPLYCRSPCVPAANPAHPAFEQLTWAAASARCSGGYSTSTIHTSPPSGNWALCAGGGYGGDVLMPKVPGENHDAIMWLADAGMSDYNCKGMGCGCKSPQDCNAACAQPSCPARERSS